MKMYDIPYGAEEFDMAKCRESAEDGYSCAQYALGECYFLGKGVPQDAETAAEWYRKAAAQGDVDAQFFWGFVTPMGSALNRTRKKRSS